VAVIRVEVEVDSEVYPELYARLRGIERPASREERLRQLAATGLLWETVRLRGGVMPEPLPAPPPRRRDEGFVDLAINVPPGDARRAAEPAPPPRRPRSRPPPKELPVLVDVVPEEEVSSPVPLDTVPATAFELRRQEPAPVVAEAPPLPPPLSTEVHAPTPKSRRVKRMLDRGLFKNG
jgi:hypothetical protein